jgi:hypothetical protein
MKAQISFEFMLYLVVAAVVLSAALSFSARIYSKESALDYSSALMQFVAGVNFNMQYASSKFYAYVPRGVCEMNITKGSFAYRNVTYSFDSGLSISPEVCNSSGSVEYLLVSSAGNGSYTLGAAR